MSYTKGQLIEAIIKAIPYSDSIKHINLDIEDDAIRFIWRDSQFRVSTSGFTEMVENGMLSGGNLSILMEALIKNELINIGKNK